MKNGHRVTGKAWKMLRAEVWARDHGHCAICAVDLAKQSRIYDAAKKFIHPNDDVLSAFWVFKEWVGCDYHRHQIWDCDHVVPVCDGGDNSLENLRVLCLKCHRQQTAALTRRIFSTPEHAAASLAGQRKSWLRRSPTHRTIMRLHTAIQKHLGAGT